MTYVWHFAWAIGSFLELYFAKFSNSFQIFLNYCQQKSYGPHRFSGEVIDFGKDEKTGTFIAILRLDRGHPMLLKQGLEKAENRLVFTTEIKRRITPAEEEAMRNLAYTFQKSGFNIGETDAQ